ncbi:MAG TPA: ClbS/DfsB family four-helix bundle protein [Anaerolineae bacterium]|nr:ClbS/DfsB family four-helix bundle protein [Anaerolineae bacterium]
MTKVELIQTIEREWEALQAAVGDLTEAQLTAIPVVGEWTVKDVLAHIAVWASRLVTDVFKAERGVAPNASLTPAQVDALNEQFYREQKDRPVERVLEDLHGVHLMLLNRLEELPDNVLSDPHRHKGLKGQALSAYVAEDSAEHYREHTADILAWRQRLGHQRTDNG